MCGEKRWSWWVEWSRSGDRRRYLKTKVPVCPVSETESRQFALQRCYPLLVFCSCWLDTVQFPVLVVLMPTWLCSRGGWRQQAPALLGVRAIEESLQIREELDTQGPRALTGQKAGGWAWGGAVQLCLGKNTLLATRPWPGCLWRLIASSGPIGRNHVWRLFHLSRKCGWAKGKKPMYKTAFYNCVHFLCLLTGE